jgi:hypothetical protein
LAQRIEVVPRGDPVKILLGQVGQSAGKCGYGGGFDRHCAQQIIRTPVAAGFIDRQQLNELETNSRDPINELPHRPGQLFALRPEQPRARISVDTSRDQPCAFCVDERRRTATVGSIGGTGMGSSRLHGISILAFTRARQFEFQRPGEDRFITGFHRPFRPPIHCPHCAVEREIVAFIADLRRKGLLDGTTT